MPVKACSYSHRVNLEEEKGYTYATGKFMDLLSYSTLLICSPLLFSLLYALPVYLFEIHLQLA